MNVVKVMGGLGNQLFQYAFSKSIEKYGDVALDLSFYNSRENFGDVIPTRQFMLDKFNCKYSIHDICCSQKVNEKNYHKDVRYKNAYFDGYWQKTAYFNDVREQVIEDLTLKDEFITAEMREIVTEMNNCNSVAVHIRRTDYLSLGFMCGMDYYSNAIRIIRKNVYKPTFYIFSDDIAWCEKSFHCGIRKKYINMENYQDFYLMSNTKYNIIANSTYSFWAAYLNKNAKIICAPKNWLGDPAYSPIDFEGWILL